MPSSGIGDIGRSSKELRTDYHPSLKGDAASETPRIKGAVLSVSDLRPGLAVAFAIRDNALLSDAISFLLKKASNLSTDIRGHPNLLDHVTVCHGVVPAASRLL